MLSNSTRKLSWSKISKMRIAVKNSFFCVTYYNFRHTFVAHDRGSVLVHVAGTFGFVDNVISAHNRYQ